MLRYVLAGTSREIVRLMVTGMWTALILPLALLGESGNWGIEWVEGHIASIGTGVDLNSDPWVFLEKRRFLCLWTYFNASKSLWGGHLLSRNMILAREWKILFPECYLYTAQHRVIIIDFVSLNFLRSQREHSWWVQFSFRGELLKGRHELCNKEPQKTTCWVFRRGGIRSLMVSSYRFLSRL